MTTPLRRPLARLDNPSPAEFERFALRAEPVIIENALGGWKALADWSVEYFARRLGSLPVTFKQSSNHIHPDLGSYYVPPGPLSTWKFLLGRLKPSPLARLTVRRTTRLDEYLRLLTSSADAANYYLSGDELLIYDEGRWSPELAPLREDFSLPPFFAEEKMLSAGVWVSAKGVRSHLHYDGNGCHNLNAQVTGEKHVELFSPDQMDALYPHYVSKLDPMNFSQVNVEDVDHRRFPKFKGARGFEGTLRAGDLLFIPAYWYHSFLHRGEFNSNINFWWHPEFVHLSPVAVRAELGRAAARLMRKNGWLPPIGLIKWAGRLEHEIIDDE